MPYLEDKTILVTGASRGIGAATARIAKCVGPCLPEDEE